MVREWERHENFSLYEDALPVLDELAATGSRSASSRTASATSTISWSTTPPVDAVVGSKAHGRVKPHASIFVAA